MTCVNSCGETRIRSRGAGIKTQTLSSYSLVYPLNIKCTVRTVPKTITLVAHLGDSVVSYTDPHALLPKRSGNVWKYDETEVTDLSYQMIEKYWGSLLRGASGSVPYELITSFEESTMTDVKTKDFKKISAQGGIVNSPMSIVDQFSEFGVARIEWEKPEEYNQIFTVGADVDIDSVYNYATFSVDYRGKEINIPIGMTADVYGTFRDKLSDQFLDPSYDISKAMGIARSKLQEAELELPTTLAEMPKTLDYVLGRIKDAYSILKAIKKGDFKKYAPRTFRKWQKLSARDRILKASDMFLNAWMEARYAIRPIMLDIEGAIKILNKDRELPERKTFRGFVPLKSTRTWTHEWSKNSLNYKLVSNTDIEIESRAGLLCASTIEDGLRKDLGVANVATMVWEVIPYSFVVSWFIDISNLLYHLQPNLAFAVIASWGKYEQRYFTVGELTVTNTAGDKQSLYFRDSTRLVGRNPNPQTYLAHVNINYDSLKFVDTIALLRGLRFNTPIRVNS